MDIGSDLVDSQELNKPTDCRDRSTFGSYKNNISRRKYPAKTIIMVIANRKNK
jgi:hypothetical protein